MIFLKLLTVAAAAAPGAAAAAAKVEEVKVEPNYFNIYMQDALK